MRKFILLFIAVGCFICSSASAICDSDENTPATEKEKVELGEETGNTSTRPRSLYMVDAYYYPSAQILELVHDGLGETDIYLVDSYGTVVHQSHFVSSIYSAEQIIVPDIPGIYTVIIDSDAVYARGVFSIN